PHRQQLRGSGRQLVQHLRAAQPGRGRLSSARAREPGAARLGDGGAFWTPPASWLNRPLTADVIELTDADAPFSGASVVFLEARIAGSSYDPAMLAVRGSSEWALLRSTREKTP